MSETIDLETLPEVNPSHPCELDVWVHLPEPNKGYVRRKRWKTFKEVYQQLHNHLNVAVCDNALALFARQMSEDHNSEQGKRDQIGYEAPKVR